MATIINHEKGFKIIKLSPDEALNYARFGIGYELVCDNCNEAFFIDDEAELYYIAVLNMIFCKSCYEEWVNNATYYPEDATYELNHFNYYKELLNDVIPSTGELV